MNNVLTPFKKIFDMCVLRAYAIGASAYSIASSTPSLYDNTDTTGDVDRKIEDMQIELFEVKKMTEKFYDELKEIHQNMGAINTTLVKINGRIDLIDQRLGTIEKSTERKTDFRKAIIIAVLAGLLPSVATLLLSIFKVI